MIEQRSAEWFKQRVGMITGSRVGAILGLSPFKRPKDVLREMVREYHGAESEFKGNIATEYGQKFEAIALGDLEIEAGIDIEEVGFVKSKDFDYIGASPDGLVGDTGVVEIKCPFGKRDSDEFDSIHKQPHYYAQVQIELLCTRRQTCYFYQWSQKGSLLETVPFDSAWIDENIVKLERFYQLYLSELKKPERHLAPLAQNVEAEALVSNYKRIKEQIDQLTSELNTIRGELIERAGGQKTCFGGELLVYPVERKGAIDYAKIPELKNVDLEQYRKKGSKSWAIR